MPTALITGASRGLGLELTRQYLAAGWQVIGCVRNASGKRPLLDLPKSSGKLEIEILDVADHAAIDTLAKRLTGRALDLLINNAGTIGPLPYMEHIGTQHFGTMDYQVWENVLRTNTFGPLKMAEAFVENLAAGEQSKLISISSTVGSNTDSSIPAFAYASSKAALNKVMTLLARQLKDRGIIVGLLCPGHVDTRMGGGVATLQPEESVRGMRKVIAGLTLDNSGNFTRYNGERIEW